jgi:hypothetical protein
VFCVEDPSTRSRTLVFGWLLTGPVNVDWDIGLELLLFNVLVRLPSFTFVDSCTAAFLARISFGTGI